jgi:hypothetical protein
MPALIDGILNAADLSEGSKTQYLEKLAVLTKMTGKTVDYIVEHPREMWASISRRYSSPLTRRAYVSAIKALFHHNDTLRSTMGKQLDMYTRFQSQASEAVNERYRSAEPSLKERKNWVPWPQVLEKERFLAATETASTDHLLLAMYSLIEPLRQDYGAVHIILDRIPPEKARRNYLAIARDGSWGKLILNTYKTAKHYGTYQRDLPARLLEVIKASLIASPRAYLFVDDQGLPYKKTNSFTQFSNRTLRRLFGKNVTVSLLRHAYISNIDFNASTPGEIIDISKNMAHSMHMQQLYRRKVEPLDDTLEVQKVVAPVAVAAPVAEHVTQDHDGSRYVSLLA